MGGENYLTNHNEELTRFYFVSQGNKGNILKVIAFSQWEGNTWNLGFGDFRNGRIDDRVVSNNGDIGKVMQSVASSAFLFLEKYPELTIIIQPVDEKRKRLYNLIFQRHYEELAPTFTMQGKRGNEWMAYSPDETYDAFEVSLKPANFTKN
jgi:hypothetical protein